MPPPDDVRQLFGALDIPNDEIFGGVMIKDESYGLWRSLPMRISHLTLFAGDIDTGKASLAKIFLKKYALENERQRSDQLFWLNVGRNGFEPRPPVFSQPRTFLGVAVDLPVTARLSERAVRVKSTGLPSTRLRELDASPFTGNVVPDSAQHPFWVGKKHTGRVNWPSPKLRRQRTRSGKR